MFLFFKRNNGLVMRGPSPNIVTRPSIIGIAESLGWKRKHLLTHIPQITSNEAI